MSVETFCYTSTECPDGQAKGYVTIADWSSASAGSGNYSYFFLDGDTTNSVSRQAVFSVDAAGTYDYFVRARSSRRSLRRRR